MTCVFIKCSHTYRYNPNVVKENVKQLCSKNGVGKMKFNGEKIFFGFMNTKYHYAFTEECRKYIFLSSC